MSRYALEKASSWRPAPISVPTRTVAALEKPLKPGFPHVVVLPDGGELPFVYDPATPSPLFKVNQVGYSTLAAKRYAYLGGWPGPLGPWPAPPEGTLYQTEQHRATVTSLRLDCLAAAFLNRSRGAVDDLLRERKLFLNGCPCENGSKPLKPGDKVSVRGVGKFRFLEEVGTSKKGKCVILFEKYI